MTNGMISYFFKAVNNKNISIAVISPTSFLRGKMENYFSECKDVTDYEKTDLIVFMIEINCDIKLWGSVFAMEIREKIDEYFDIYPIKNLIVVRNVFNLGEYSDFSEYIKSNNNYFSKFEDIRYTSPFFSKDMLLSILVDISNAS